MYQVLREGGIVNRDTQPPFRQRTLLKDRRSQLIYLPEIKQPIKSEETLKGLEVSFFQYDLPTNLQSILTILTR